MTIDLTAATALAFAIVTCRWEPKGPRWEQDELTAVIRALQNTPDGAELLRLIVRDDILGAADTVANALWPVFANL